MSAIQPAIQSESPLLARGLSTAGWLAIYFGCSFVFLFGVNYWAESRAYARLSELNQACTAQVDKPLYCGDLTRTDPRGWYHLAAKNVLWIATYRERFEDIDRPLMWLFILVAIAIGLGIGTYLVESRRAGRWTTHVRWAAVAVYALTPFAMNRFIYSDMVGTLVVVPVFLFLFFIVRQTCALDLHSQMPVSLTNQAFAVARFTEVLRVYERYLTLSLGTIAVIPLTFLVAANNIMENRFLMKGLPQTEIFYSAIHHPFMATLIFYSAFGCSIMGIGVTQALHNKIKEALQNDSLGDASPRS